MSVRSLSLALLAAVALFASVGCSETPGTAAGDRAVGTGSQPTAGKGIHNGKGGVNAPPPIEPINK